MPGYYITCPIIYTLLAAMRVSPISCHDVVEAGEHVFAVAVALQEYLCVRGELQPTRWMINISKFIVIVLDIDNERTFFNTSE